MTTSTNYDAISVQESHRTAISAHYLGPTDTRGTRIKVTRADKPAGDRDPNTITVSWDYSLNIGENYAQAIKTYLEKAQWGGRWIVGSTPKGAIAVWSEWENNHERY